MIFLWFHIKRKYPIKRCHHIRGPNCKDLRRHIHSKICYSATSQTIFANRACSPLFLESQLVIPYEPSLIHHNECRPQLFSLCQSCEVCLFPCKGRRPSSPLFATWGSYQVSVISSSARDFQRKLTFSSGVFFSFVLADCGRVDFVVVLSRTGSKRRRRRKRR